MALVRSAPTDDDFEFPVINFCSGLAGGGKCVRYSYPVDKCDVVEDPALFGKAGSSFYVCISQSASMTRIFPADLSFLDD